MEYVKITRVFFEKMGRSKYISHLDMARCMQRALKRSELPIWYTQGFNPRMYMNFTLAISLGYESLGESMDIKMIEDTPNDEIAIKLNKALPEGIRVIKVATPIMKPEKIAWADYFIIIEFDSIDSQTLSNAFQKFMAKEEIIVQKRSKKGPKDIDLKPLFMIKDISYTDDKMEFMLTVASGINLNINPSLIVNAFCESENLTLSAIAVKRTKLLTEDFEEFQ